MSRKIRLFSIFVFVGLFAIGSICLTTEAFAQNKVRVGLIFGLTGAASPIGPLQLDGAKLAIKEVNAAGGVKLGGKKVPIEFFCKGR